MRRKWYQDLHDAIIAYIMNKIGFPEVIWYSSSFY